MAVTYKFVNASRTTKATTGVNNLSRSNLAVERTARESNRSGAWLTFADGSRFRRSTKHEVATVSISLDGSQDYSGERFYDDQWIQVYAKGSAGGYYPDAIIAGNFNSYFKNDSAGLFNGNSYPVIPTMRRNEAVTKALSKLADQKANIGENLATFAQTIKLIRDPAGALVSSLKYVRSRPDFRQFLFDSARSLRRKSLTTRAAEEYLKYVYGWRPLMQDIFGIIELAKQQGDTPLLLSATGRSKQTVQNPSFKYRDSSRSEYTEAAPLDITSDVRCNLWARVDPNFKGLRTLNQLGLMNPLALAWELVTFSFVIDWFLPIGPVLNAMSAPTGLLFVDGSISNRISASANYENWYYGIDNWASGAKATGSLSYEGYFRDRISNWPLPGFWIEFDPFKSDRSLKALALSIMSLRNARLIR